MNGVRATIAIVVVTNCVTTLVQAGDDAVTYRNVRSITTCKGPRGFTHAMRGIAVQNDLLYVVGDQKLLVLRTNSTLARSWPTEHPGNCVAVHPDGRVFVGEEGQIEIFSPDGKRSSVWRDAERLDFVTAIGFAGDAVIVADADGRCLRRYTADGEYVRDIGKGKRLRGFMLPNRYLDFFMEDEKIIRVADPGRHRISRYTIDGERLDHVGHFATKSERGFPGCCNPTNIARTPAGDIVAVQKAPPMVKVFGCDGEFRTAFGGKSFDPNCKNSDAAVDRAGNIYVIDTVRLEIVVFGPEQPHGTANDSEQMP